VEKSIPYVEGPEAAYGNVVHKHFEDRLRHGVVLPSELQSHELYLAASRRCPGSAKRSRRSRSTAVDNPVDIGTPTSGIAARSTT
jgi:hypothetical protein